MLDLLEVPLASVATTATPGWQRLPERMRFLFITSGRRTGGWLADTLAADGGCEVEVEEVVGVTSGVARLRDEVFDAVLLSHDTELADALELVEGLRAGGSGEAVVVLGDCSGPDLAAQSFEAGADAYVCVGTTTVRELLWTVARAIERHHLVRENRRLQHAQQQWLERQQSEAGSQLAQLREMLGDKDGSPLPEPLVAHYRELLRTYVIMGSGNLAAEMGALADLLAEGGLSSAQAIELHLEAVESLLGRLGSRSSRHVMLRADLLVLDLIRQLADNYHRRYRRHTSPLRQKLLPGFE